MYDQNSKPPNVLDSIRLGAMVFDLVIRILAATNHAFFRTGFGTRYFGALAFCGVFSISLFAILFPPPVPAPIMFFMPYAYLLAMLVHRARGPGEKYKGSTHSLYNGTPVWTSIFGFDESNCKARYEFWLNSLVGGGIIVIDPIAGLYIIFSAIASHLDHASINSDLERKAEAIVDAEIESELLQDAVERFRSRYR